MGLFRPSQWEIETLVKISRQVFHLKEIVLEQGEKLDKIMATQAEAAAQLKAANDSLTKIGAETQTLLDQVKALQDAAATAGNVGPELQGAIDSVVAQAKTVDDLVPDVTPAP